MGSLWLPPFVQLLIARLTNESRIRLSELISDMGQSQASERNHLPSHPPTNQLTNQLIQLNRPSHRRWAELSSRLTSQLADQADVTARCPAVGCYHDAEHCLLPGSCSRIWVDQMTKGSRFKTWFIWMFYFNCCSKLIVGCCMDRFFFASTYNYRECQERHTENWTAQFCFCAAFFFIGSKESCRYSDKQHPSKQALILPIDVSNRMRLNWSTRIVPKETFDKNLIENRYLLHPPTLLSCTHMYILILSSLWASVGHSPPSWGPRLVSPTSHAIGPKWHDGHTPPWTRSTWLHADASTVIDDWLIGIRTTGWLRYVINIVIFLVSCEAFH